MTSLETTRKLDTTGRIVIPVKLRERLNFKTGDEYPFYIHSMNGEVYLCIKAPVKIDVETQQAIDLLENRGYSVFQDE